MSFSTETTTVAAGLPCGFLNTHAASGSAVSGGLLGACLAISEQGRRWIIGLLVIVIIGELVNLSIRYCLDLLG